MFIVENALPETGDRRAKLRLAKQIYGRVHGQYALAPAVPIHRSEERQSIASKSKRKIASKKGLLRVGAWHWGFGICEMGWPTGLEPATTRTTIWSSTIELRPPAETLDFSF
jgi:hypothetical protein